MGFTLIAVCSMISSISPPLPGEIPEEIIEQNGDESETHDSALGFIDDVADADHTVDSDQYDSI